MNPDEKFVLIVSIVIGLVIIGFSIVIVMISAIDYNVPTTVRVGNRIGHTSYVYTGIVSDTITFSIGTSTLYYNITTEVIIFPSYGEKICIHIISVDFNALTYEFIPYEEAIGYLSQSN